ncbi:MAG: hypothetical protein GY909_02175 [Oligoflexia bacterium]|nr:hypothetical protein [Oligoflexia bacterium]
MKKLTLLVCLLSSINVFSYNNVQARCFLQSGVQAICEVCNFVAYRPIRCDVVTKGQTSRGFYYTSRNLVQINPGACMNTYVYAQNPALDPLVFANAQTYCQ